MLAYLNKKAVPMGAFDWDKIIKNANKTSNIVYIFIGSTKVIGAFHSQSVNIEGEASVWDQEAGIFFGDKNKVEM